MTSERRAQAVVIGSGPAGLATAAMLVRRRIPTVTIERGPRPATGWHDRYEGLQLNTLRWMSDLPGMKMPRRHGRWPLREDWVAYLEGYAEAMGVSVRLNTLARRVDRVAGGWRVETAIGPIEARAVVIAVGHDHSPSIPEWPGREGFAGQLIHSSSYRSSKPFRDSEVLVVGSGTSGGEIATLLAADGNARKVWLSVRTPPLIMRREYVGIPSTVLGWASRAAPDRLLDRVGWGLHAISYRDLAVYGLGRSPKRLSRMRKSYFSPLMDGGFSTAVRGGRIAVVPAIERFEGPRVRLIDGSAVQPDAVIAATGYTTGLGELVGHLGVLSEQGEPVTRGRCSAAGVPGLYFAGYRFGLVALLPYISGDAKRIARAIARGD